ncbi:unnamed protein product, partial [Closterium sp. NIES-53]
PPQVAASAQVSASGPVAPPCSCRLLTHQTLFGTTALVTPPCHAFAACTPASLFLVFPGLCLPSRPRLPRPAFLALRGVSASLLTPPRFPLTTAPLQTLHMDVWGPARISGQGHECYFLLVVDDCTRYTTLFPLRSKGEVPDVLIPWIRAVRLQLCERFRQDLPVLRLHSDRGGEFSSDLLRDFCHGEGILQWFTLPASPQQNGIHERRIGLVMEVTRTSMIHAAAPHIIWSFAVWYAVHQLNLWPRVSLPETSPTLRWTGKVGDASVFRFYHPTSRRILPSQDVTFNESVPFYRLFPYRSAPLPPPPLFLAAGPPPVDYLPPQGPAPSGKAARGAASGGAEPGGAEPAGTEPECADPRGTEPEGAGPGGAESRGAEPGGTLSPRGPPGALLRREPLSPPQLREWFARCTRLRSGAARAGGAARVGARGTGAGATGGTGAAGPGVARTRGTRAAGSGGAAGVGAGDLAAGDTGAGGASPGVAGAVGAGSGDTGRPQPYFVPLLQQVLGLPSSTGLTPPLLCPPPTGGLTQRREPVSCPATPVRAVRTSRHVPRPRPPPVPGTHHMALRPYSFPQRVPLPSPLASSLADGSDPDSDLAHATSPTVPRLLATVVTDPSFESTAASALVTELSDCPPSVGGECAFDMDVLEDRHEDFENFAVAVPHLVSMLIALEGDPDAPDIPTPCSYAEAITVPPPGAKIVDGMWTFRGSLHEEIWLRHPPSFTRSFSAGTQWSLRRPVYGLRQAPREWHDTLRTTLAALGFAPSTSDPSRFVRTDTSLPSFYILVYVEDLVFATADTEALALVKSEMQKRHTCTDLGELCNYLGLQITRDRARRTIKLTQSHMVHQVLQCFGFRYSSPQSTPLPTGHSLSAPPSDESVEPSGPYPELVGCLIYLMTCTRPDLSYPLSILARYVAPRRHRPEHWEAAKRMFCYLCSTSGMGLVLGGRGPVVLTGHADASWVDDLATQRSSQGYTFSLGSGSVSWRSTRSSSVLSSRCEAEIYAGAMAAQELRWLTYLLTNLGERPRSSPVLYVDSKAMIVLCQEHRLGHRTKHIALCYFLARELEQRGQLRLAYVATQANTADIFTKALQSGDHQRFCIVLGLVPSCPHLLTA